MGTHESERTDEAATAVDELSSDARHPSPLAQHPALTILAVCAVIFLLRYMQEVFIPFVLAGLTFYALDPMVDWLQRWHVPRTIGAAMMLVLVAGGVGAIGYSLRDNFVAAANELPEATQKLRAVLRANRHDPPGAMDKLQEAATEIDKTAAEAVGESEAPQGVVRVQVEEPAIQLSEYIRWGPVGMVSLLSGVIMVFFLAYFLLVTDDLFKRKIIEVVGTTLSRKKITLQVLNEISSQIESFLLIQIFTSSVVGVVTWLALWWLGLANAAVWALCAGLFNSIPYFGPLIVTGALTVIAYVQFGTVPMALTVAGIALIITTLEGWILTPLLMGRVAQINAVVIFASLLFWSWMWGIWGLLLAVPMMMVIKAVCDRVEGLQPVGTLLGD